MVEVRLSTKEGGKGGDHRYVYCQFEVSPGRNKQKGKGEPDDDAWMGSRGGEAPKKAESLGGGVRRAES